MEKEAHVFGARPVEAREPEIEAEHTGPDTPGVITPPVAPIPAVVTQLLMFGMSHEAAQRVRAGQREQHFGRFDGQQPHRRGRGTKLYRSFYMR